MARMIPERFDESTTSHAESFLYYRLQEYLDGDWTVLHTLPWLDGERLRLQQGECDFVLLHPRFGMLALEAKSGLPEYDGTTDQWRFDDGAPLTDPFMQARRSAHYLDRLLGDRSQAWRQSALAFGYAVAFPDARAVRGHLRPDMDRDLILLEQDLDDVQSRVIKVLGRFGEALREPRPDVVSSVLDVLKPSFRLVATLAPTIALANRELVRLTGEQAELLEGLADNKRLVVRGGAGTGKSLLIVAEARRLAAAGQRVLVLCFNRSLAAHLREQLFDVTDRVMAVTFHDYCLALLEEAGMPAPPAGDPARWARLADEALSALPPSGRRFDAVLVDEAQDFEPDWWLLVEEVLADRHTSRLQLFLDDQQNLYGRAVQLPFTEPVCRLRRNCRNTRPIAAYAHAAIGIDDEAGVRGLPEGPAPVVVEVATPEAERDAVRRALHELIHEQGLAPAQVVMLGAHKLANSSFADVRKLGNFTVRDAADPDAPNTIRYSTVHKFKGLEADAVLLVGIGEPSRVYDAESWRRFVYVGASRARVVLRVFVRTA